MIEIVSSRGILISFLDDCTNHSKFYYISPQMDTQTPNLKKCQTQMSGVHPKLSDGVVTRSVCVRNEQGDCQQQFYVRVRNCGIYYVYNLPSTLQFQGFSHCFRKGVVRSYDNLYCHVIHLFRAVNDQVNRRI